MENFQNLNYYFNTRKSKMQIIATFLNYYGHKNMNIKYFWHIINSQHQQLAGNQNRQDRVF